MSAAVTAKLVGEPAEIGIEKVVASTSKKPPSVGDVNSKCQVSASAVPVFRNASVNKVASVEIRFDFIESAPVPPSPPSEQATARQDQGEAGQSYTGDGS